MKTLYPDIDEYKTYLYIVSTIHTLYIEESGNPKGIPIIHIKGGPGGKCKPKDRQYFDPQKYRIINYDQRGCGQSTPQGEISENTTQDLLEDIEKIRIYLKIESWIVTGGSWGSTLALAYAQKYSQQVTALIIRGIFTARRSEIDWLYGHGSNRIFPDYWEKVQAIIRADNGKEFAQKMLQIINGSNEELKKKVVYIDSEWETKISTLIPEVYNEEITDESIHSARILNHYMANECFLDEGQLIANASRLKHIPITIIQGRYDMVCPFETAWDLYNQIPHAKFITVPDAGHGRDSGIIDAYINALDEIPYFQGIQRTV